MFLPLASTIRNSPSCGKGIRVEGYRMQAMSPVKTSLAAGALKNQSKA